MTDIIGIVIIVVILACLGASVVMYGGSCDKHMPSPPRKPKRFEDKLLNK